MDHKEYDKIIADVQLVCNCNEEKARYIVTLCARLNADVNKFIEQLPQLTGQATPSADDVIAEIEKIATKHGVTLGGVTFPQEYENREQRRKHKSRLTRRRAPNRNRKGLYNA